MLITSETARPVDRRGYYRSPITLGEWHRGKPAPNKGRTFPPEVLRPREVLALMDECGRGHAGKRDRALIVVLWRAGLRISEALALLPKDLDLDEGRIRVLHGKGDKARTAGIDPMGAAVVRDWLEDRAGLGVSRGRPVFCVITHPTIGEPMHSTWFRIKLHEAARRAGIEKRVTPHTLRHTYAYELAGEGADIRKISLLLGHSNTAVTARYIDHLNPREVVELIRARPWPEGD
jgi:site-specific recombinase XerD